MTGLINTAYAIVSIIESLIDETLTDTVTRRWREVAFMLASYSFLVSDYLQLSYLLAVRCSHSEGYLLVFFRVSDDVKPAEATLKENILRINIPGFIIITAAVTCCLLAPQWGGVLKSRSFIEVVGTLVGFGILLITLFVIAWQQGGRALLLPSV